MAAESVCEQDCGLPALYRVDRVDGSKTADFCEFHVADVACLWSREDPAGARVRFLGIAP